MPLLPSNHKRFVVVVVVFVVFVFVVVVVVVLFTLKSSENLFQNVQFFYKKVLLLELICYRNSDRWLLL